MSQVRAFIMAAWRLLTEHGNQQAKEISHSLSCRFINENGRRPIEKHKKSLIVSVESWPPQNAPADGASASSTMSFSKGRLLMPIL